MRALFQVIVLGARIKVAPWMFYAFDASPLLCKYFDYSQKSIFEGESPADQFFASLVVLVSFGGIHPGHVFPSRFLGFTLDTKSLAAEEWGASATAGDSDSTATNELSIVPKRVHTENTEGARNYETRV